MHRSRRTSTPPTRPPFQMRLSAVWKRVINPSTGQDFFKCPSLKPSFFPSILKCDKHGVRFAFDAYFTLYISLLQVWHPLRRHSPNQKLFSPWPPLWKLPFPPTFGPHIILFTPSFLSFSECQNDRDVIELEFSFHSQSFPEEVIPYSTAKLTDLVLQEKAY